MRCSIFVLLLGLGFFSTIGLVDDAFAQVTHGPFTFDTDNDQDEASWTFVSDNGPNGLPASTGGLVGPTWAHDTDCTPSGACAIGPTSGQGGNPDGYVFTEASGSTPGDTLHMTFNTILDASANDWVVDFFWNQRGNLNVAVLTVQTNENGAGWITRGTFATGGPDAPTGGPSLWNPENLDLTGVISDASTQVRFLVTFPSSGSVTTNDFGLDTITITGTPIPGPTADYGDAPDTYGTLFGSGGPHHLSCGPTFGPSCDTETNGVPTVAADGDGADDADGVTFSTLTVGQGGTATVTIDNNISGACLNGWIDFDASGVFDASERIIGGICAANGVHPMAFGVPAGAVPGDTYARFRVQQPISNLNPTGVAPNGEVEDYKVTILAPADLTITKSDDIDPIVASNTLTYTVTVNNLGPGDATNVEVTDTLPAGVTFVSTSGCAEDPNGDPTCSLGTIASGGSAQYTIEVDVDVGTVGFITNTATVTSDTTLINTGDDSVIEHTQVIAPGGGTSDGTLLAIERNNPFLHTLDPTDGSIVSTVTITLTGETVSGGNGLTVDPTTGDLYALLKIQGDSDRVLVTINPSTGVATLVGSVGFGFAGIAFDNLGDLFGVSGDGAPIPESYYSISKTNGATTLLCELGNGNDGENIAFNPDDGKMYHFSGFNSVANHVFETIDTTSGATCGVTDIPLSGDFLDDEPTGMVYSREAGLFYVSTRGGETFNTLNTIGVATELGDTDDVFKGLAILGIIPPPPPGGDLIGINQEGDLFTIDRLTGTATVLGNFAGQGQFAEIECPLDSLDCFVTTGGDPSVPNRRTIAPINLAGIPSIGAPSPEFPRPIPGMEFVGNTLYASDTNGDLFTIDDTATASTTLIGNMGERMSGLAYDVNNGIMYGMNGINADLYTIDLTTAAITFIGNTGTGEVGGMEFGPDGILYGGGNTCADSPPNLPFGGAGDIFTIDTTTGVATRVGPTGLPPIILGSCTSEPSVSGLTLVGVPLPTVDSSNGESHVHPRPVITLPFVDPGFCFDLTCLSVEPGTVFTHLDLQTINSGSTHTISLTIHCHYGVERCNYAAIGASPPGTDMRDAVWKIILTKNIDGTWDLTKIDPNGDLGDVTATAQNVNDNKQLQVSFNIEFLLASLLGSPPEGEDFPEGSQIINVEIRDSKGGYSTYIFNEGIAVNDIYAYPQVETSFDAPLVYEKLCLNEDEKDRNTCAFEMVQQWTIQQAEEKLKEIYGQYSYEMDSYDESEQYKK